MPRAQHFHGTAPGLKLPGQRAEALNILMDVARVLCRDSVCGCPSPSRWRVPPAPARRQTARPRGLTLGLQEISGACGDVLKSEFLTWVVSRNSNCVKLLVLCVLRDILNQVTGKSHECSLACTKYSASGAFPFEG